MRIQVHTAPFDLASETAALYQRSPEIGVMAVFLGLTRHNNEGSKVAALTLEHYAGMTEKALVRIAEAASERWTLMLARMPRAMRRTG